MRCCWSWRSSSRDEVDGAARRRAGRPGRRRAPSAALWELTRGNALFLRELVRHGVDRGLLAEDGGVWRWRGEVEAGTRLAELVDLRIDDAGAERARACWSSWRSARRWSSGCSSPASRPRSRRWSAASSCERRTDGRRRFVDVAPSAARRGGARALTPTRARGDPRAARGRRRGARRAPRRRPAADRDVAARGGRDRRRRAVRARGRSGARPRPTRRWPSGSRARRCRRAAASARGWRSGGRSPPPGAAPRPSALLADLAARGRRRRASARRSRWRGRATCSGRWTAPTTRTRCCGAAERARARRRAPPRADGAARAADRGAAAARRRRWPPRDRCCDDAAVHERARLTAAMGAVEALFTSGRTDEAVALAEDVAAGRPPAPRRAAATPSRCCSACARWRCGSPAAWSRRRRCPSAPTRLLLARRSAPAHRRSRRTCSA